MSKRVNNIFRRKNSRREIRYSNRYEANKGKKYGYCYRNDKQRVKKNNFTPKSSAVTEKMLQSSLQKKRLSSFCDEWLVRNRTRVKESTYVKYRGVIENHVKPRLGDYSVEELSSDAIEKFSHELLFTDKLSSKTVKDILTMLNSVIKYIEKQLSVSLSNIEIVYPKVAKKEVRVLSKDEQTRLVNYLLKDMDEYKFGIMLSLLTGMRLGEVCALRWKNICLKEGTVKVNSTIQRLSDLSNSGKGKTKIVITEPKSNTSVREIPLTEYAAKLCEAHWCNNPDAFVLTGEQNRYIEPRTMQYKIERFTEACGIEGVHFHTLRHTFATRCVEVDFEIKSLSEILGHSSPRITLERYVHSSMKLKRDNMNKLTAIGF